MRQLLQGELRGKACGGSLLLYIDLCNEKHAGSKLVMHVHEVRYYAKGNLSYTDA